MVGCDVCEGAQGWGAVSTAIVIAIGVRMSGEREVIDLDVGPSEDGALWHQFLRGLIAHGLSGVQLVTSDVHNGLKAAIAAVLTGASWQRCRVHFVRNALALVPKGAAETVAETIRTVFVQPDAKNARDQWRKVADGCRMTSGGNTRKASVNLLTEALGTRLPANRPTIPGWLCCWPECWRTRAGTIPRKPGKRISSG